MKTLKDVLDVYESETAARYEPEGDDEKRFMEKHTDNVLKHEDPAGNKDDVFKGNTKMADRKNGYKPGEDEDVYEALLATVEEVMEEIYEEADEEERAWLDEWRENGYKEIVDSLIEDNEDEDEDEDV